LVLNLAPSIRLHTLSQTVTPAYCHSRAEMQSHATQGLRFADDATTLGRRRIANMMSIVPIRIMASIGIAVRTTGGNPSIVWPICIALVVLTVLWGLHLDEGGSADILLSPPN